MTMKKQGFTLIELLVVIAIIAALMAIIMPALKAAKRQALAAVCMANCRGITQAWTSYSSDNSSEIVPSYSHPSFRPSWVEPPQDEDGNLIVAPGDNSVTQADRKRGLQRGLLFPYLDSVDVFHCPGDTRVKKGTSRGSSPAYQIFRSYTIADGATGKTEYDPSSLGYRCAARVTEMKSPSTRYIVLEGTYDGKVVNYNDYSWNFFPYEASGSERWWDPLGLYHRTSCAIGYGDGHVINYKFQDDRTIEFFSDRDAYDRHQPGNEDIQFFQKGWPGIKVQ